MKFPHYPKPVTKHEDVGDVHYHRSLWSLGDSRHASYYVVKMGKEANSCMIPGVGTITLSVHENPEIIIIMIT